MGMNLPFRMDVEVITQASVPTVEASLVGLNLDEGAEDGEPMDTKSEAEIEAFLSDVESEAETEGEGKVIEPVPKAGEADKAEPKEKAKEKEGGAGGGGVVQNTTEG
jgi:hypothetical protein